MKAYSVDLAKEYALKGGNLECLVAEFPWDAPEQAPNWKRPAVVVVPGGGYSMVSKREAEPIAFAFLNRGFHAFILTYTVAGEAGEPYPEQLLEVASAVDYVRKHAEELKVNPKEIFVVGFSAGGHLTGNLAVEHQNVSEKYGKPLDCKPTAVGLCYPVISKIHGHQYSYEQLLYGYSEEAQAELLKTLNLNESVSEQTPPAFIWATATDKAVPPDNALRYAMALDKQGIDYELHIYPRCGHGVSTADLEINYSNDVETDKQLKRISRWTDDCADFFRLYIEERF